MQALDSVLKRVSARRYDDDFVDRANYLYTPAMLAAFSLTIAAKQYVGKPIQCWAPAQFRGSWEEYTENYCFVENTYYVGMEEYFPRQQEDRQSREIQYYQWVPFMLALQIFLFILPKTLWNAFNWRTGMNINALSQAARTTKKDKVGPVLKNGESKAAVAHISNVLQYQEARKHQWRDIEMADGEPKRTITLLKPMTYVTYLYLFFKLCNLANCIVQLYALNRFLGPEYTMWGWGILVDLYYGRSWKRSGHFPRVTFCDVAVRQQGGHIENNTLQCVLMINMFNEKIYIFIWFWLVAMIAVNILNILYWLFVTFSEYKSFKFVHEHLRVGSFKTMEDCRREIKEFVRKTLGRDGVTCLRLIDQNCGPVAVSGIVDALWKLHNESKHNPKKSKNKFAYTPLKHGDADWMPESKCSTPALPYQDHAYTEAATMPRANFQDQVMREVTGRLSAGRPSAVPPALPAYSSTAAGAPPPLPANFSTMPTSVNLAGMGGRNESVASFAVGRPADRPTQPVDRNSVVLSISNPKISNAIVNDPTNPTA